MFKHLPRSSGHLFSQEMPVIAHRGGAHEAPENTLAAFRRATSNGYAIECDVRLSGDGKVVVFHDETLGRTTDGKGRVADKNFEELKVLDAGEGERVPLLTEVLGLVDARVPIIIEVKCGRCMVEVKRLVQALIKDIEDMNAAGSVVVASFSSFALHHLKRMAPKLLRGLIFSTRSWLVLKEFIGKPDILMPDYHIADKNFVDAMHERGYSVFPWTVDDKGDVQRLIESGVDGIITNRPSALPLT
jgi:glycerophosphoryl diester phosphodiesterase